LVEVLFDEEHEFSDSHDFIDLMVRSHAQFPMSSRDAAHMYIVQSESRYVIKKNVLTQVAREDIYHQIASTRDNSREILYLLDLRGLALK
jgi:uncharacterized protein YjfI (DUF2170 family)